jgi:spermidine synthase
MVQSGPRIPRGAMNPRPQPSAETAAEAGDVPARPRIALWLVTAFLTGGVIMGLELVSFRLYAPYFGYTIYVWGSMISVVMVALAVGYTWGGWMADRSRSDAPLYLAVLASAIYQLAIVLSNRWLLSRLWPWGDFAGTTVATLVIFTPPMIALAVTSPFVIRLLARAGHVGVTAGKVYALATVGSIAGTFITSFHLLPRFGTQATLKILCAASALIAVAGLAARRRIALAGLLVVAALAGLPKEELPTYEIWRAESAYNLVRVIRVQGFTWLALNDARFSHTTRQEGAVWSGSYQDEFALGPLLVPARRLLVLGMGAGGSIRMTRLVAPQIEVDAVEIDRQVVEAAARFFDLHAEGKRLRIHIGDARPWLARDRGSYDLVHVDLYHGGPYVPFYLITEEFFRLVSTHLAPEGLLMMNVYDRGDGQELLLATVATLRRVFPSILVRSRPDRNHLLLAFPQARTLPWVRARLAEAESDARFAALVREAGASLGELVPPANAPVFTDDRAPVEEMTRRMLASK